MSKAQEVYASWSEGDRKAIAQAPRVTQAEAVARLTQDPKPSLLELAQLYCGMLKNGEDEVALGEAVNAMKVLYKGILAGPQLNGMAGAAKKIHNQSKAPLSEKVGNAWDVNTSDPFNQVVQKTKVALKSRSEKQEPTLFRSGKELARIRRVDEAQIVERAVLDKDGLASAAEMIVNFYSEDNVGNRVNVEAPKGVIRHLFSRSDELPLPYLNAVIRVPVFGENGLIDKPGYDRASHVYYAPDHGLVIPEVPKQVMEDHVSEARRCLVEELLGDFPFDGKTRTELVQSALGGDMENPPPASLLNCIGFYLEQFVRPLIDGPLPLALFDKPTARTGATKLANIGQIIVDGVTSSQALSESEEEQNKCVVGMLNSTTAVHLFDNVSRMVGGPIMAKLFTDRVYTGRKLSTNDMLNLPVTQSFAMTGNNPPFSKELAERVGRIRLDAGMERPGTRGGWRHANIETWAAKNRGKLIWSLLVLIRNWHQAGKPAPSYPEDGEPVVWGAYDEYVRVVGGIIGAAAPNWTTWQQNRTTTVVESEEHEGIKQLLAAWWDSGKHEITAKAKEGVSLVSLAIADQIELPVARVAGGGQYEYKSANLGRYVGSFNDSVFNIAEYLEKPVSGLEVRIVRGERQREGMAWKIAKQEPKAKDAGEREDEPAPQEDTVAVPNSPAQGGAARDNVVRGAFPEAKADVEMPQNAAVKQITSAKRGTAPRRRSDVWTHPQTGKTYYRGEARKKRREYEAAQA